MNSKVCKKVRIIGRTAFTRISRYTFQNIEYIEYHSKKKTKF
jgi:hypothetical protein